MFIRLGLNRALDMSWLETIMELDAKALLGFLGVENKHLSCPDTHKSKC